MKLFGNPSVVDSDIWGRASSYLQEVVVAGFLGSGANCLFLGTLSSASAVSVSAGVFSRLRTSAAASIFCSVVSGAAVALGAVSAVSNHATPVTGSGVDRCVASGGSVSRDVSTPFFVVPFSNSTSASRAGFFASRAAAWRDDPVPFPAGCIGPACAASRFFPAPSGGSTALFFLGGAAASPGSAGGSGVAVFSGSAGNSGVAFLDGRAAACRAARNDFGAACGSGAVSALVAAGNGVVFPAGCVGLVASPVARGSSAAQFFPGGGVVSPVAAGGSGAAVFPVSADRSSAAFLASKAGASRVGSVLATAGIGGSNA
ncbi:hypothetical protein ACOSQ4_022369 [Xanthoceras sorbifolium]